MNAVADHDDVVVLHGGRSVVVDTTLPTIQRVHMSCCMFMLPIAVLAGTSKFWREESEHVRYLRARRSKILAKMAGRKDPKSIQLKLKSIFMFS